VRVANGFKVGMISDEVRVVGGGVCRSSKRARPTKRAKMVKVEGQRKREERGGVVGFDIADFQDVGAASGLGEPCIISRGY
jgi:hypothetical protein